MTGYASAQQSGPGTPSEHDTKAAPTRRLGIEIRSVNSRFLDLAFRLPDELRQHEPALRELLTAQLKRGKVELRAAIENTDTTAIAEPTPRLLQRLNGVQDTVRSWLPNAAPLSVAEVIRLSATEHPGLGDLGDEVVPLVDRALKDMIASRQREGTRLAAMLTDRLAQLRALAEQARPLVPQLVEQQRQRFLERWKEAMALTEGATLPEAAQDRALSEATAFAIRIDVAEELTRISVDMKVLIEQMREQVQNIE